MVPRAGIESGSTAGLSGTAVVDLATGQIVERWGLTAHDTNLLFYGSEEAQEGRDAYLEKRKPDFSRFPKRA